MGTVQDTLCDIRKFTPRDNVLGLESDPNILLWVPNWDGSVPAPAIIKPEPCCTRKQIPIMVIHWDIDIHLHT